jgi:predicted Zn-dependent protease
MVLLWQPHSPDMQKVIRNTIIQGIAVAGMFLLTWLALAQVNWVETLKIESTRKKLEEKLGKIFLETFRHKDNEITDRNVTEPIDSLVSVICRKNDLESLTIEIYILRNDEVNAFALPGNRIVLFTGLIKAADSPEELCGVLCHELAHIEKGHVMKKLIKEVGLNALVSMATSGAGPELLQQTAGLISSTAYDRNLESEADSRAAELLDNAQIDPKPFADFLTRVIAEEGKNPASIPWISTHPDSELRAQNILDHVRQNASEYQKALSDHSWKKIKELTD